MLIDGGVALDERVDVSDRDQQLHLAGGARLRNGQLIEVTRVVVVDRAPGQTTEIAAPVRRRGALQPRNLQLRGLREVRFEAAVAHRLAGDLLEESTG